VTMKVRPLSEAHPHPLGCVWAPETRRSMGAFSTWDVPLRGDLVTPRALFALVPRHQGAGGPTTPRRRSPAARVSRLRSRAESGPRLIDRSSQEMRYTGRAFGATRRAHFQQMPSSSRP
jgi:hypothetical protein